jgi:hypothetical protein
MDMFTFSYLQGRNVFENYEKKKKKDEIKSLETYE